MSGMTKGLDPSYDAGKMKGNPNIALYTRLLEDNGVDFAIQALPTEGITEFVIPVGVDVAEAGEFSFSVTQKNLDNYNIILEDREENTFTDLRWDYLPLPPSAKAAQDGFISILKMLPLLMKSQTKPRLLLRCLMGRY